jgi:hypothetical protein
MKPSATTHERRPTMGLLDEWDGYARRPAPLPAYVPGSNAVIDAARASMARLGRRNRPGPTPARRFEPCPRCGGRKRKESAVCRACAVAHARREW